MEGANNTPPVSSPWDLIKVLLSPKTLPHVFLLISGTGGLFALISTVNDDPGYAAIIFTSAMISYIILATIGNRLSINKWLLADKYKSKIGRFVGPLILPIMLMTSISAVTLLTIAKEKNVRDIWAVCLASLFIFWSIGQGLALKSSIRSLVLRSKSSRKSETIETKSWDLRRLIIEALIFSISIGILRGIIITNFISNDYELLTWLTYSIVCFILITIFLQVARDDIIPLDTSWTRGDRTRVHRTSLLLIILIAWHLSSAWSRLFSSEVSAMLLEEVILVILTVVSAVWAMTNRNRSSIGLISKDTAILWAIAFGFGYAGSITVMSGLTESLPILGNVSQTLGVGHILTAFTLLIGFGGAISRPQESMIEEE